MLYNEEINIHFSYYMYNIARMWNNVLFLLYFSRTIAHTHDSDISYKLLLLTLIAYFCCDDPVLLCIASCFN